MNSKTLDNTTKVTLHGSNGDVVTSLGDILKLAGILNVKLPAVVSKPATPASLAKQIGKLQTAEVLSVIAPAKKQKDYSNITIYCTQECIPGDESQTPYLALARTRSQDTGEILPDEKQNFGFDKSWSYHQGEKLGQKWPLKFVEREVGGVRGKFWVRYVPQSCVTAMLQGLRDNFPGATLCIDGQSNKL